MTQDTAAGSLREAFLYAFGPYEFARLTQALSGQLPGEAPLGEGALEAELERRPGQPYLNRHVHVTSLADAQQRTITAPNNDTLYTSAVLELSAGPVELVVPAAGERYLSVALLDPFCDVVALLSPGEGVDPAGTWWILGPEDRTPLPPGVRELRAPCDDLWLLARVFVAGDADLPAARAVQRALSVRPRGEGAPRPYRTRASHAGDARNLIRLTNEVLGRAGSASQSARSAGFAAWGLRPGALDAWDELSAWRRFAWRLVGPRAPVRLEAAVRAQRAASSGWISPPPELGACGERDDLRAAVALVGFGALPPREALYFRSHSDARGERLSGAQRYRIRVGEVPTRAFWSICLYQPDGEGRLFFFDNPSGRFSINSASEELAEREGPIELALQRERPRDPSQVWLPTPAGPFEAFLRVYRPGEAALSGGWSPPPIEPC